MNLHSGLMFAIISPFLSSISTVFKAVAVKELGPFAVLSFGSILGASILIIFLVLKGRKFSLSHLKHNFKDFLFLILTRPILGDLLFVFGLGLTLGAKAILFTKIEPYFVLLFFIFAAAGFQYFYKGLGISYCKHSYFYVCGVNSLVCISEVRKGMDRVGNEVFGSHCRSSFCIFCVWRKIKRSSIAWRSYRSLDIISYRQGAMLFHIGCGHEATHRGIASKH